MTQFKGAEYSFNGYLVRVTPENGTFEYKVLRSEPDNTVLFEGNGFATFKLGRNAAFQDLIDYVGEISAIVGVMQD